MRAKYGETEYGGLNMEKPSEIWRKTIKYGETKLDAAAKQVVVAG